MEIIGCDYTTQLVQTATNKDKAIRDLNFYIAKLGQDRIRRILALFVRTFYTYIPMTDITIYHSYFDIHVLSC